MSDQPLKSTFKDEREMESSLFPITDISRGSFGNGHRLAKRIHWFARLQFQEKRTSLY